jgi:hypothetical protein
MKHIMKSSIRLFAGIVFSLLGIINILYAENQPPPETISYGLYTSKQFSHANELSKNIMSSQYTAYLNLLELADNAMKKSPHAIETLTSYQFYTATNQQLAQMNMEQSYLAHDANYAHQLAIAYRLTGNQKYAKKAIEYINAWAKINKRYIGVGFQGDEFSTWKTPHYYDQTNADLNMASSGAGLIQAAILLKNDNNWSRDDKDTFSYWCKNVYRKNTDRFIGSEKRKNEWLIGNVGSTARLGILLHHVWEGNKKAIIDEDVRVLKDMLDLQIGTLTDSNYNIPDMLPVEVRRGDNGMWYTAWSLSSLTASMEIIDNETGIDLFRWKNKNGTTMEKALDRFFIYVQHPDQWPWLDGKNGNRSTGIAIDGKIAKPNRWGGNLYESMWRKYNKPQWKNWASDAAPITYFTTQFNWNVPSLLEVEESKK